MRRMLFAVVFKCHLFMLVGVIAGLAHAAGTDIVQVAGSASLRGRVVARQTDGSLLMVVRRDWLVQAEPGLARQMLAEEAEQSRAALETVLTRVDELLAAPAGTFDDSLLAFLRREKQRITGLVNQEPLAEMPFVWLRLPADRVRGVQPAEPGWSQLVQWGWHAGIDQAETLPQRKLAEALAEQGVDTTLPPPSLIDRLPPLAQDDNQWRARVALLQDAYGSTVNFQGTGDLVIRADAEVSIEALLPVVTDMLKGDVGGLLDLLGGGGRPGQAQPDRWLASARSQAGSEGRFRATRVQTKPEQGVVDVESAFEVRLADGTWGTVWRVTQRVDATQPREGLEERIAGDPRVGQAITAIKAFGVVDQETLTEAIRFGAATMEAQEAIDRTFAAFRSDHTLRLDGLPLVVIPQTP